MSDWNNIAAQWQDSRGGFLAAILTQPVTALRKEEDSNSEVRSLEDNFHASTVTGNSGESRVPCDQRSIECFSESEICRIIGGQITPKRPDPAEKNMCG